MRAWNSNGYHRFGVVTNQRLEQLRTDVEVVRSQIGSVEAQREAVVQQQAEGEVSAPADGRVLTVPVTRGAVSVRDLRPRYLQTGGT